MQKPTSFSPRSVPTEAVAAVSSVGAAHASFVGTFESSAPNAGLRMEGRLEGHICFPEGGTVHIGPTGNVQSGDITADYVLIEGVVAGNVHARKMLELAGTAVIQGKVTYDGEIDIHCGARLRASIEFTGVLQSSRDDADSASKGLASPSDASTNNVVELKPVGINTAQPQSQPQLAAPAPALAAPASMELPAVRVNG